MKMKKCADKKVLVMGLGVFGGGASSAKWFFAQGAEVRVTDLRDEKVLAPSMNMFTKKQSDSVEFILGKHRKSDFTWADIVVVNPGVPRNNEYLKIAKQNGATLVNDTSIFFQEMPNTVIGVTGTRGKTTTTNWIAELLSNFYGTLEPTGNTPKNPLLSQLSKLPEGDTPLVAELSSWQLEFLPNVKKAPHIAVITNLSRDHMNRYSSMNGYALAKAGIFKHQTESDHLILNRDNTWTEYFMLKKPKAQLHFFSRKKLPKRLNGIYTDGDTVILQQNGEQKELMNIKTFEKKWGSHNVENLLASLLAIHLLDPKNKITKKQIDALTDVQFRQQIVKEVKGLTVVNDTTSTSPEALISAIERFANDPGSIFISGGTDKELDYAKAAKVIKKHLKPAGLILLEGSGTKKLIKELRRVRFYNGVGPILFDSLEDCVAHTQEVRDTKQTLVFSPGAASFEKFKNEFDRGEKFNALIKKLK